MKLTWRKSPRFWLVLGIVGTLLVGSIIALLLWIPPHNCNSPIEVGPSNLFTFENLRDHYETYGYVAHAFGDIDGIKYTNCREAFELNYRKGFRIFEVDLVLLKDRSALCAHDDCLWMYGLDSPFIETTADELSGTLCLGKYTPLTGSALIDLVHEYSDAHFILDTKPNASGSRRDIIRALVSEAEARCPSVLDRMIPHVFGPESLSELAGIYPFKDYMFALYSCKCGSGYTRPMTNDEVVQFVRESRIRAVMMWWDTKYMPEFQERLNDAGAVVYVHSLDDSTVISDFRADGVGVFSDGYFPPILE